MSPKNEAGETIVVSLSALFVITWICGAGWLFFNNVDFKHASETEPNPSSTPKAGTNVAQPNVTNLVQMSRHPIFPRL
jgi:hypothetical protein